MPNKHLIKEFEKQIGRQNVMAEEADRQAYAYDSAVLDAVVPALVIRPTTTEELGQTVRLCHRHGLPLTVRGSGTNLSGGTIPAARNRW